MYDNTYHDRCLGVNLLHKTPWQSTACLSYRKYERPIIHWTLPYHTLLVCSLMTWAIYMYMYNNMYMLDWIVKRSPLPPYPYQDTHTISNKVHTRTCACIHVHVHVVHVNVREKNHDGPDKPVIWTAATSSLLALISREYMQLVCTPPEFTCTFVYTCIYMYHRS